jgi:hypothetical protein
MTIAVSDWRAHLRYKCDGLQLHYDGVGEHQYRHATAYQTSSNGRRWWLTEVLEDTIGGPAESYTYGQNQPMTSKMAREVAERFVTGRKIPKRLEGR